MRLVAARVATFALAGALAGTACGKHEAGRTAMSCDEAAGRAVAALVKRTHERVAAAKLADDARANLEQRAAKLEALAPRLRAVIASRCDDDRWPPAVIECHAKIASMDELRACRAQLSPDQQAAIRRDELDVLADAQGLPGFGSATPRPPSPEIARLEQEVRRLSSELADARREVEAARDDAERAAARAEVQRWQSELDAANDVLARARAAAQPVLPTR